MHRSRRLLEAITSDRVYRAGQPVEFGLFEIEVNAGTRLGPAVAAVLGELLRGETLRTPGPAVLRA